ncbi:MAG: glycosyltransferase [Chthoniobacterales bacterium]
MLPELPSLRGFQPRFYTGGPSRFYLALLYDLVALLKPRRLVLAGSGDGQAFLTVCQSVRENAITCECIATRSPAAADDVDDSAWEAQSAYGQEFFGDFATFIAHPRPSIDGMVDLLFIDDVDAGSQVAAVLNDWRSRLSPAAVVLLHGTLLDREDAPGRAWSDWAAGKPRCDLDQGIGLSVVAAGALPEQVAPFFEATQSQSLRLLYELVAARISAEARGIAAERDNAALRTRQIWLDSMVSTGWQAQEVMDHQARAIADLEQRFANLSTDRLKAQEIMDTQAEEISALRRDRAEAQQIMDAQAAEIGAVRRDRGDAQNVLDAQGEHIESLVAERARADLFAQAQAEQLQNFEALRRDRAKAQLVMDAQQEQLQHWVGVHNQIKDQLDRTVAELKQRKQLMQAAKQACRRGGKCFQVPSGPKVRRPFGERLVRELQRLPRSLRVTKAPPAPVAKNAPKASPVSDKPADAYATWIAEHEPNAAALAEQRLAATELVGRPKLSVVVPLFNTPENYLDELIGSLVAQTYENWELCLVDGGSDRAETLEALRDWTPREPRLRLLRLPGNLGISENTNRALEVATGDFILLADHDDVLPPFAFYEMAVAIAAHPRGDIFYTDEDRLSPEGKRRMPFFKPEWSPELLCSFMYIGHLTAYRRGLVKELGGFRKEYDLSQDYDFALRATERAREIVHVPHVCYHWREHPASGSAGGKPDARKTNLAALGDAMRRRNLPAEIVEYPTANRARLTVAPWPRVSVIVPTDSPTRAQACLVDLARSTDYPDLEIVIVTNSKLAVALGSVSPQNARAVLVPYDKPFNFSDKCNVGAEAATGTRVIFFNDDVETEQRDWIQNVIEQLENPEVGAVAPKMLYETGNIQHAGLVTGVRGFAGTAFHQRSGNWTDYFNMAQSLRDVSALSGACLAMRRDDFLRLGGFDAVNTPIAHSDFDLCFKIREAGMRCVYTPFATLRHVGHVSISVEEKERKAYRRDKANIFLLKRWGEYTTYDPYFPPNMRNWLYVDSPTPITMSARDDHDAHASEADLLFVSHDLSWSGAPLILLEMAKWCRQRGFFVVVMSPKDGPLREKFAEAAIPVIVDELITRGHESFTAFARDFDCVVASTIFGAPIVNAAKRAGIPHLWWIHEGRVAEHYISADAEIRKALAAADTIITPDTRSSRLYQPFAERPIRVLPYGIPDPATTLAPLAPRREGGRVQFLLLGTIEQRKGQQVLLEALRKLPDETLRAAEFLVVGRAHDAAIAAEVTAAAKDFSCLTFSGGVSPDEAHRLIAEADVMVSASWDETGPLILMEAAALGKALLSTNVGSVAEFLVNGDDALFFQPGDATALAAAIEQLVREPELRARLATNARQAYDKHFKYERFANDFTALVRETTAAQS